MQDPARRIIPPESGTDLADEEVVARVLSGEKELYEVIMRRYNQRMFKISRGYVRNEDDAEEIMQEAYVKAYESLPQFRNESKFSTWLTRILINEALAWANRRKRFSSLPAESGPNGGRPAGNPLATPEADNPAQKAMNSELRQIIEAAIDRLPEKFRSVYIMREIEQMSTAETGDCLNISAANVKVRLNRAKGLLRDTISEAYRETEVLEFHLSRCDRIVAAVLARVGRY